MKIPFRVLATLIAMAAATALAQEPAALRFAEFDRCELVSGEAIDGCRIGYRTIGTLNAERDNTIVIPTWYTGTSEELIYLADPGILDPARYFIVLVDALGNGVSSSPSNSSSQSNDHFPQITIADMVESQHRLLTETLEIERAHAVVGFSMGGMQAFEWAVRYPDFARKVVPVIGSPRLASYDIVRWETLLRILAYARACQCDEAFELRAGLSMLARLPENLNSDIERNDARQALAKGAEREPREIGVLWNDERQAEAMIAHDITGGGEATLADAARGVRSNMFIVVGADDYVVTIAPALEFARLAGARSLVLDAGCGHGDPWCDSKLFHAALKAFIESSDY